MRDSRSKRGFGVGIWINHLRISPFLTLLLFPVLLLCDFCIKGPLLFVNSLFENSPPRTAYSPQKCCSATKHGNLTLFGHLIGEK